MKAHAHIDPLWKSGQLHQAQVYARLERLFGEPIHVGESDIERCKEIVAIDLDELTTKAETVRME
jgi:hypothetical protein